MPIAGFSCGFLTYVSSADRYVLNCPKYEERNFPDFSSTATSEFSSRLKKSKSTNISSPETSNLYWLPTKIKSCPKVRINLLMLSTMDFSSTRSFKSSSCVSSSSTLIKSNKYSSLNAFTAFNACFVLGIVAVKLLGSVPRRLYKSALR